MDYRLDFRLKSVVRSLRSSWSFSLVPRLVRTFAVFFKFAHSFNPFKDGKFNITFKSPFEKLSFRVKILTNEKWTFFQFFLFIYFKWKLYFVYDLFSGKCLSRISNGFLFVLLFVSVIARDSILSCCLWLISMGNWVIKLNLF